MLLQRFMYHTDHWRGKGDCWKIAKLRKPHTIRAKEKQYGEDSEKRRGDPPFGQIVSHRRLLNVERNSFRSRRRQRTE
jgi:hypothetical protein